MRRAALANKSLPLQIAAMDLEAAIAENRQRVADFLSAARGQAAVWATPVHPGKWSPAEVAEHIVLTYRESAKVFSTGKDMFPAVPFFLRPILRRLAYDPTNKTGRFDRRVRTFKSLTPLDGAKTPDEGAKRIEAALAGFEQAARAHGGGALKHKTFGTIDAGEYVRFQGYHTRHHQAQLTA